VHSARKNLREIHWGKGSALRLVTNKLPYQDNYIRITYPDSGSVTFNRVREMKVKDLLKLKPPPVTINAGKAVEYAMRLMLENNISSLVIVDDNDQPVSIITERDIFHLAYRFRGDMMDMKVGESRKDKLFVGRPDDDIKQIAKMMTENNIRHVPIMGEDNHLTGVVSIRDIVKTTIEKI